MFLKVIFLFVYVLVSEAQFEGERCIKGGTAGVCRNLNRCQTAIDDLKRRINPQMCSFDNADPVVCCLDGSTAANPVATTTSRPSRPSTTEYIPPVYDYEAVGQNDGECEPIPEFLTVKKTGQKALDSERCIKGGTAGVCRNLNRCQTAIDDLKRRINPQMCSFDNADPVVCCLDGSTAANPVATTTSRPSRPSTTEYIPPVYDYEAVGQNDGECEPIPEFLTVKKTGQKALDKCIEYQEKYVYPCEKRVALTGLRRSNRCHHNAEELIIGSSDAKQYEFPHMVMVGYGEKIEDLQFLCGGALISDRFILTAGHCIFSRELGAITYMLVGALKRTDSSDRSKLYKVKNIIKHPEYKPPAKYNDIALIETENPIALDQFTVPACLPAGDPINEDKVQATGWGLDQYSGTASDTLQKVFLHKFTTTECKQKYMPVRLMKQGFDAQSQSCYEDKQVSKDTCQGDSGGPIQVKHNKIYCMYNVVGVTSFGRACGFLGESGIYTRVINYVPWIESIVWP